MSKLISKNDFLPLESGFSIGGLIHQAVSSSILGADTLPLPSADAGTDRYWMIEAIRESMKGVGITNPNPAVGCILVDANGMEIARGATQAFRGLHAERVAFAQVKEPSRLLGATAYVTLEPCSHYGNQPPCVDLLLASKIRRVVVATGDPNPQVNGAGIRQLEEAGFQVELGLLGSEARAWNFPFFAYQNLKRPVVALKWAQTLDGQLADDSGSSQWISGPLSRSYTHWLRQRYDAILVGAKTVLSDFPSLTARDCASPLQSQPLPLIFDPRGICLSVNESTQSQLNEQTFAKNRPVIYATTQAALDQNTSSWIKKRDHITLLTVSPEKLVPDLVSQLSSGKIEAILGHPIQSVFVEGGPTTLNTFLQAGYADILHVFVAPKMTGGFQNRVHLKRGLSTSLNFKTITSTKLGDDTLMELISQT